MVMVTVTVLMVSTTLLMPHRASMRPRARRGTGGPLSAEMASNPKVRMLRKKQFFEGATMCQVWTEESRLVRTLTPGAEPSSEQVGSPIQIQIAGGGLLRGFDTVSWLPTRGISKWLGGGCGPGVRSG
jgi:hypothetical protein